MRRVVEKYSVSANGFPAEISICDVGDFVMHYEISTPAIGKATQKILDQIKVELIKTTPVRAKEVLDPRVVQKLIDRFKENAEIILKKYLPDLSKDDIDALSGYLVNEMIGLGDLEIPLADDDLEEIAVNNSFEPIWVYHKRYGWLKTNIFIQDEDKISDYANVIGRRVGRQITVLNPLMDAHMHTGDRVNATLFPISTKGNTITIRKFARKPWTIVDFILLNTINLEVASLLWLAVQYELNVLVAGGTASGKTSMLNTMMPFIPPNQRIISIEETRELSLPKYSHWVPLTTREPNPEGKGAVEMIDLMVNALRMRPDRIVIGEIRRKREAEVAFEAMRTGHSVYATFHADRAEQTKRRLITPPISLPEITLETLHLIIVQFRHRRLGIRRTFEVAELLPIGRGGEEMGVDVRILYRWRAREDSISKEKESLRLMNEIALYTGMTKREVEQDLLEKQKILSWMVDNRITDVHKVGEIMSWYYKRKDELLEKVEKGEPWK